MAMLVWSPGVTTNRVRGRLPAARLRSGGAGGVRPDRRVRVRVRVHVRRARHDGWQRMGGAEPGVDDLPARAGNRRRHASNCGVLTGRAPTCPGRTLRRRATSTTAKSRSRRSLPRYSRIRQARQLASEASPWKASHRRVSRCLYQAGAAEAVLGLRNWNQAKLDPRSRFSPTATQPSALNGPNRVPHNARNTPMP
jgi:hypothetical protein